MSLSYKNVRFGPVDECIYCRRRDVPLSDEHIIPFSLDGTVQLAAASCQECAKITCKLEGSIGRTVYGNMRIRNNFPTRRRKQRPKTLPVGVVRKGVISQVEVASEDHPAPTSLLWFTTAGILAGRAPWDDPGARVGFMAFGSLIPQGIRDDEIDYGIKIDVKLFARFLAKVAHCSAVEALGVDGFEHLLIPTIFGVNQYPSYLVGGLDDPEPPLEMVEKQLCHQYRVEGITSPKGERLVLVRLRLFANWTTNATMKHGMPTYYVVAGRENELTAERVRSSPFYSKIA